MSVVYFSYIDPFGQKASQRVYIADDEDEIDFLDRVKSDFYVLIKNGYHILRVEVT